MAMVDVENVQGGTVVIAENGMNGSIHYHTYSRGKGEIVSFPEDLLGRACLRGPLERGQLRIVKGGKYSNLKKKGRVTQADAAITHLTGTEPEPREEPGVISMHRSEESRVSDAALKRALVNDPVAAAPVTNGKAKSKDLGMKLVRRGKKKSLSAISRVAGEAPKGFLSVMNDPNQPLANVINVQGERAMPVSAGDDGSRLIMSSAVPGGAYAVSTDEMLWSQINSMSRATDVVMDAVAQERKASIYAMLNDEKKLEFVNERTDDIVFLRKAEVVEYNSNVRQAIRARIEALELKATGVGV